MKVWLVYEGDNYDNSLVAVVSSEEKAKEYTRVWPYETYIEEHEVDEDSDFPPGLLPYGVSYEKDKEYVHRCHPDTPEESTHHNGNILIRVWAENEQHASILARSKYLDLLSRRFIWQQLGDLHWGACPPGPYTIHIQRNGRPEQPFFLSVFPNGDRLAIYTSYHATIDEARNTGWQIWQKAMNLEIDFQWIEQDNKLYRYMSPTSFYYVCKLTNHAHLFNGERAVWSMQCRSVQEAMAACVENSKSQ